MNRKNSNAFTTLSNAKTGEIITFGMYPQAEDGVDLTPIKWRVLQNSGSELFILSEYILDSKRYHRDLIDITWQDSDLRKWLNDEFYTTAFNDSEKRMIKTTHCGDNGENSPDTEDEVFLLSVSEVRELTDKFVENSFSIKRRAIGTEFAKTKKRDGCHLYVYDKTDKRNYLIENEKEYGCSWWWLRTQGNQPSRAFFVGPRSSVRSYGEVTLSRDGVRPALKMNLVL
ncbi:DUF6273 domain-containing protein [Caldalkalibacillus mannanilyticus]|uniref:DUF6273 domain-containing protein n=1 Tax=Caldalkalibacillus mannanilyticus TaxID=1418 RepID=UPI00046A739E|nr:DUF6273 domain-containing protein [Caldalkalibacillus mannanilyticus]